MRNILEQQPHGISEKKGRTVRQRKTKRNVALKICCQLFKTSSQSFCCIILLTSCKRKHIMHADWWTATAADSNTGIVQMDLSENFSCVYQEEVSSAPWKETVSHCTLSWSGSGTKVYQWSFCQITTIMTRQWWYLILRMFSTTSKNTLQTMFALLRSGLMDLPVSLRINTSSRLLTSPCLSCVQGILELFSNKPWQRCCRWCWWYH